MEPHVYTPVSAVANLRRSAKISVGLALVAVAVTWTQGHPFMGAFVALGLALGVANNVMLQRAVVRRGNGTLTNKRFTGSVAGRLGSITLFAIALALLVRPDGLGTFVGLAVFQILMIVGAAVPLWRSMRPNEGAAR